MGNWCKYITHLNTFFIFYSNLLFFSLHLLILFPFSKALPTPFYLSYFTLSIYILSFSWKRSHMILKPTVLLISLYSVLPRCAHFSTNKLILLYSRVVDQGVWIPHFIYPPSLCRLLPRYSYYELCWHKHGYAWKRLFNTWYLENWLSTCRELKLGAFLSLYATLKLEFIKDLDIKTLNLLDDKVDELLNHRHRYGLFAEKPVYTWNRSKS